MTNPTFNVGDLVQHRASGERGVVVEAEAYCTNPVHQAEWLASFEKKYLSGKRLPLDMELEGCGCDRDGCTFGPSGNYYSISHGFGKIEKNVPEKLLEKIEE